MDEPDQKRDPDQPTRVEGRRIYCAWEDCGKKLEKGRTHYCKLHEFWPK